MISEQRRVYLRSFSFFRPRDLAIYVAPDQPGDDGRFALALSEVLVFSLLSNHTEPAERQVFGYSQPVRCVSNNRQPLCGTIWDRGNDVQVWIMDGRQRGGDSDQRGAENPGAIEAINRRLGMLCDLARELAGKSVDPELLSKPEMMRIRVRNEAQARHKKGEAGWHWARAGSIALYVGGKVGDDRSGFTVEGLIDWKPFASVGDANPSILSGGPTPIPYVAWLVFEPEDRDPGTHVTQLGSLALKGAQVATPPTVLGRQFRSLCGEKAPPRIDSEADDQYFARLKSGGPYGQGLPVSFVAEQCGFHKNTIQDYMRILDLIPEVQDALDANARGEDGLSFRQVIHGGFFVTVSGDGGRGEKVPKSRAEQEKLLRELCGKRGVSHVEGLDPSESSGGGDRDEDSSREGGVSRREVSVEDSALDRHRADEPRAQVGPDSPGTADAAPKSARLDASLFQALRDRAHLDLELLVPDSDGKLADGGERTPEKLLLYYLHDAYYHLCAYFAGDTSAFAQSEGESPTLLLWRRQARDGIDEVLRAKGLMIRANAGAVSTGAPVLPVGERAPTEVIVTPRAGGEVKVEPATQATATQATATQSVFETVFAVDKATQNRKKTVAKPAKKPIKPKKAAKRGPQKPKPAKAKPKKPKSAV